MPRYPKYMEDLYARRRGIQAARRALDLDETTYRKILREIGGVSSSTELKIDAANKVLDHLNRLQGRAQVKAPQVGKPSVTRDGCAQLVDKIEALLTDMKLPWSYGLAILTRMHKCQRWEWAKPEQLTAIIAALTVEQDKRRLLAAVDAQLSALGKGRDNGAALAKALGHTGRGDWTRNAETLKRMWQHLQNVPGVQS